MNACELRIKGLSDERTLAAVRWELFVFHDIRDVVQTSRPETVAVLYEGRADVEAWCETLAAAGYQVEPVAAGYEHDTAA